MHGMRLAGLRAGVTIAIGGQFYFGGQIHPELPQIPLTSAPILL